MTLLDKAKSFKYTKRSERVFTQEELEVFIALAKGEITLNQARNALNYEHSGTIYVNISKAFIQLYERGLIEFKPFKKGRKIICKKCQKEMILFEDVEDRDFCSRDCENKFKNDRKELFWKFIQLLRPFKKEDYEKKDSLG